MVGVGLLQGRTGSAPPKHSSGCWETFGKHQERESNRLMALGSDGAPRWLLPGRRNGAERPAPAGGLAAILAKRFPGMGLVLGGGFPLPGDKPALRFRLGVTARGALRRC